VAGEACVGKLLNCQLIRVELLNWIPVRLTWALGWSVLIDRHK
jgi:hypothetical protein